MMGIGEGHVGVGGAADALLGAGGGIERSLVWSSLGGTAGWGGRVGPGGSV